MVLLGVLIKRYEEWEKYLNKRHIETLTQTVVGFIISFIILKCYGMSFSESLSLQITFLVVSYIRSYLIRSAFARMERGGRREMEMESEK